jgi:spoIIIJ-associated protein
MTDDNVTVTEHEDIEEAIQYAKRYLEDILSFFGLNTDVHATTEDEEVIELDIPSTHLNGFLIGQHGDTMRSLQFLVSSALKNNSYRYTRVNVDVAEYKKQRADRLAETAGEWVKRVLGSGEPMDLKPMNAADRRTVHKVAAEAGLVSESVGEGRERHIVLRPGDGTASEETSVQPADVLDEPAESDASSEAPAA